jgi:hypothetical protein
MPKSSACIAGGFCAARRPVIIRESFISGRTNVLNQWQFRLLTALGVLSLALVITNIVLFTGNREAQNEFSTRAQYIQQSQQLEPLYQGIIRRLAEIAAKTNDAQITQLLTAQGITYTVNPPKDDAAPKAERKGRGK